MEVAYGLASTPDALISQVIDFVNDPLNPVKIPVLGPLGQAIGINTAMMLEDPNAVTISRALGSYSEAFLLALGAAKGVQARLSNTSTSEISVFRQGTFADETMDWGGNYVKGKEWAKENPLTTPDYARKYGLPAENTGKPDWIVKGRVRGNYETRVAGASHNNPANTGGGIEIIPDNPDNVRLNWFHMPDK